MAFQNYTTEAINSLNVLGQPVEVFSLNSSTVLIKIRLGEVPACLWLCIAMLCVSDSCSMLVGGT